MVDYFADLKIMFINEFDIFLQGSSEHTTIQSIFGDVVIANSCSIRLVNGKDIELVSGGQRNYYTNYHDRLIYNLIDEYCPDVIYTASSSIKILSLFCKIKIHCKTPILIHYYDNWRECGRQRFKNVFLRFIEDKKIGALVISDEMKTAYQKKYKGKYHTYMALNPYSPSKSEERSANLRHIVYAGGLHLARYEMLLMAQKALSSFPGWVLDIFTSEEYIKEYAPMFDPRKTVFHRSVEREQLINIYAESDALLYVENVDEANNTFIRYSMSTKIPEYLSSNKPVICLSKPGTASYAFLKRNRAALFAENETELQEVFKSIITNASIVGECVNNAQTTYAANFDVEKTRRELAELICQLRQ